MVSREEKRAAMHEKLQLLRSLTNSNAVRKSSIIIDASKYIRELKGKVARLTQEIITADAAHDSKKVNLLKPQVRVERAEKGLLLIDVFSGGRRSCPAMLAAVLEAMGELGLDVMEANASCAHHAFRLAAVGRQGCEGVDAQAVKEAVRRAINESEQEE